MFETNRLAKRVGAALAALLMAFSAMPIAAFAEEESAGAPSIVEYAVDLDAAGAAFDDTEVPAGSKYNWERLWGKNSLQTMKAITNADSVWTNGCGRACIIATRDAFPDALCAAGLAGYAGAPILITNPKKLSIETEQELKRIKPRYVAIVGGTAAVSSNVESQIKSVLGSSATVERAYGPNAVVTSRMVYESLEGEWSDTAIVACYDDFKDALSIAPFAYWYGCPVFLTNKNKDANKRILNADILEDIKYGGFTRVIIVGGTGAVSSKVEGQLRNLGTLNTIKRLGGKNSIETSKLIAQFEISEGMGISHLTVATNASYKDALCAVPLCGMNDSVLVLMTKDGGRAAFDAVYKSSNVYHGHVVGGEGVISKANYNYITSK